MNNYNSIIHTVLEVSTSKTLLFLSIFLLILGSCQEVEKKEIIQEYPSEWMYNQRAYPDNYINKKAVSEGIRQTQRALARKSRNTAGIWSLKGPINIGGRITDVAISPINDNHLYVSTAVGGVFKTTDKGQNWTPIFDNIGRPSIGNIAIAASDSQRIYVGTGEANASGTSGAFFGDGIYRSDDAGTTWNHVGLEDSQHIGRIVVDPNDKDRIFVAATGTLYGKNEERGVYRSNNAGNSWEKVLYVNDSTAVIDVVLNPSNTDILFAATWERIRYPWGRIYGGESSGVYRSMDGGDTWLKLGNGLPVSDSQTGRIGLAIAESNPSTVYASYTTNASTNEFSGLYKSTDNGDTWNLVAYNDISDVNATFGWYFGNLRVHPTNANEVYVLGQQLYRTTDGGANWTPEYSMHVDHHSMEYSRNNTDFILAGNDGGAYLSEDAGSTWQHFENLPITQFYNIEVDNLQPSRLFGGTQDNNTIRTTTGNNNDWHSILGGDGFQVNVDKNDSNNVYAEYQWGNLYRSTDGGNSMDWALDGIYFNDRTNWNTPVEISPFDTNVLFYGSNKLYISTNKAVSWNPISDDLTNGEHASGSQSYGTLTAIAPSYANLDVIYTGSDDGNVSVTFDAGATWQSIDADLPDRFVTQVSIHPNDDLTAYVTFSGFHYIDYLPHIFKTTDGGQNWEDISGNLPNVPINDVVVSSVNNSLFIATDTGVWYSSNQGVYWDIVGNNLPIGIVADIKIHEPTNTLYAGTFGRSLYTYDLNDIGAEITDNETTVSDLKVYPNPIFDSFKLDFENDYTTNGQIFITDVHGKTVMSLFKGIINSGMHSFDFELNSITAGGANWTPEYSMHVDHHSMEYSRNNTDFILAGNDGGAYLSEDAGSTWQHFENLPITQFYNIEVDNLQPSRLFGGTQDNNTIRTTTGNNNDWHSILGGDGFQVNVDKNDSNNVYAEYQWGNLYRSTDGGNSMDWALDGIYFNDRTNWNTPVEISPFDTNVLFYGSNKLYISTNKAVSWNPISGA